MVLSELRNVRVLSCYELAGMRELRGLCAAVSDVFTWACTGVEGDAGFTMLSFCTFHFEPGMQGTQMLDPILRNSEPVRLSSIDSNPAVSVVVSCYVRLRAEGRFELSPDGSRIVDEHMEYFLEPLYISSPALYTHFLDVIAVSIRDPGVNFVMRSSPGVPGFTCDACRIPSQWFPPADGYGVYTGIPFIVGVRIPYLYGD